MVGVSMGIVKTKRRRKVPPLELILKFYDSWLREPVLATAARVMGVDYHTVSNWIKKYPEFAMAKTMADKNRGNREEMAEYIIGHLSDDAKPIWEECKLWANGKATEFKVKQMLRHQPKRLHQELYLHALVRSNFDPSTALEMTGTNRLQVAEWMKDPAFFKLCEEIHWHKKNFFEKHLIALVEEKHPAAVIFVNKTVNADRGYSETIKVQHSGTVDVGTIDVDSLDLPLDVRRIVLEALRKQKNANLAAEEARNKQPILEAEEVPPRRLLAEAA